MKPPSKHSAPLHGHYETAPETTPETETTTASPGHKHVDLEALTQVITSAQLHSQHGPRIDPTSLGNLARRAGVPDWNVKAALRQQALRAQSPKEPRLLLGDALVQSGALAPAQRNSLIKRQRAMRASRPSRQDTIELVDLAIAKTLALAGLKPGAGRTWDF